MPASESYCFGSVVDGASGLVAGELVVAGAGGAMVWLRGQDTTTKTTTTTISATIAYQKMLVSEIHYNLPCRKWSFSSDTFKASIIRRAAVTEDRC
jgi:hypothetical protein